MEFALFLILVYCLLSWTTGEYDDDGLFIEWFSLIALAIKESRNIFTPIKIRKNGTYLET